MNLEKLSNAISDIKSGESVGIEDFFLLTYKNTYADIRSSIENEEYIWNILRDVYLYIFIQKTDAMPEANLIRVWIRLQIKDVISQKGSIELKSFSDDMSDYEDKNIEDTGISTLIDIEERLKESGLYDDHKSRYPQYIKYIQNILMIIIASIAICVMIYFAKFLIDIIEL